MKRVVEDAYVYHSQMGGWRYKSSSRKDFLHFRIVGGEIRDGDNNDILLAVLVIARQRNVTDNEKQGKVSCFYIILKLLYLER